MKHGLTALLLLACQAAFSQTSTFDLDSRYLTLPSVQVGNTIYNNLVIRIDSLAVISVGSVTTAPPPSSAAKCTAANFTIAKFNQIAVGMTVDQVTNLLGCQYDATFHVVTGAVEYDAWDYIDLTKNQSYLIQIYFLNGLVIGTPARGGF